MLSISGVSVASSQKCLAASHCFRAETVSEHIGLRLRCTLVSSEFTYHKLDCADHHQLSIILDILGTPSLDDFYAITSQRSREYIRALPFRKKKPFSQLFPTANPLVRIARRMPRDPHTLTRVICRRLI